MEKKRGRRSSKIRRKTISLTPKPINIHSIKTKVQHKYILKDKERPDDGNPPGSFWEPLNHGESTPSENRQKSLKKVHMSSKDDNTDTKSTSSVKIDFAELSLRKKIADVDFTSNIKNYFKKFEDPDKVITEGKIDVTETFSELSTIDPDINFQEILNNELSEQDADKLGAEDFIYCLSALEASAVLAVFDKAIDQLSILKHLLPHNPVKVKAKYRSVEERFGRTRSGADMKDIQLEALELHPADAYLMRLQQERAFLQDTLSRTSRTLAKSNSFWPIRSTVEDLRLMAKENLTMAWKWPVTSLRMRQARHVLKQSEKAMSVMPIKHSITIQEMQEGMSHTLLTLQTQQRYVERWEAARRSQHRIILNRGESKLRKKIMEIGVRTVHELRVGEEVDRYVGFEEKRLLSLLSAWEKRHDEEMEKIGMAMMSSKLTLDIAQLHTQTALEEFETRQVELDRWHKLRENQAQRVEAVLKIQVWWRTILYRRRLLDAYNVIKHRHLERSKFGTKIIKTAVSLGVIKPPPPPVEDKKKRRMKPKDEEAEFEEYIKLTLRRMKVPERLALARKSIVRDKLVKTRKLLLMQSLWGSAEAKKRKNLEAERRAMLVEQRRRIREAAKSRWTGFGGFGDMDRDKFSGGSDEIPLSTVPPRRQVSRPYLPGISPRFSTPLTDLLARASFAAKMKRLRGSATSRDDFFPTYSKMGQSFGSVDRSSFDDLIDYIDEKTNA